MPDGLPKHVQKPSAPPVKCQGIKTRLVRFIASGIRWDGAGRWIEPFMGSGAVGFNIQPRRASLADSNRHVIRLYAAIQRNEINETSVRDALTDMGGELTDEGAEYYYAVRERFNTTGDPLDLLFLNRSCFNGVMRFNSKGGYNVPFGKKTERFRPAYVTKICNQIRSVRSILAERDWEFRCQDWRDTLSRAAPGDFVYVDPPYIGRHADYFNGWSEQDAKDLAAVCQSLPCGFALSMWKENKYRSNPHIAECWGDCVVRTQSHFYHVGSTESLRNPMIEALVIRRGFEAPEASEILPPSETLE